MNPSTVANLKMVMRMSIVLTELQHTCLQLRLLAALLAGSMIFDMLDPALLLLERGDSLIVRAASATSLGSMGTGIAFVLLAAGLVPFLALQCGCWPGAKRIVTKATCLVLGAAALLWLFLSWRCLHLDLGQAVPMVFARNGCGMLLFALALALSLNAELLRGRMEQPL